MPAKFQKFLCLSFKDKLLFFEAFFWLGVYRAAVLTLPFKYLTRDFRAYPADRQPQLSCGQRAQQQAQSIALALRRAAKATPWKSVCLPQALAAARMLRRRKIPGCFYLGVCKDTKGAMEAHAWSFCKTQILTGAPGHERFAPVSLFCWQEEPR